MWIRCAIFLACFIFSASLLVGALSLISVKVSVPPRTGPITVRVGKRKDDVS